MMSEKYPVIKVKIINVNGFFRGQVVDMPETEAKRLEKKGKVKVLKNIKSYKNKSLFDYPNKEV